MELIDHWLDWREVQGLRVTRRRRNLFRFADLSTFSGTPDDAFGCDRIHATEAGSGQIATPLNDQIRQALPAAKRAAVGYPGDQR